MKKQLLGLVLYFTIGIVHGQDSLKSTGSFWNPDPPNYNVHQAFEVESLFPMFFYGGYHVGVGYRYDKFRVRVSLINGGTYNSDEGSPEGPVEGYERYYEPSPGLFLGYNLWKNLELYGYYEYHAFQIKQLATTETQDVISHDVGLGLSYQFFIGRTFYVQPGVHTYFRSEKQVGFMNGQIYTMPTFELTPVIRVGARIWKEF